ncbi:FAD:protein FMN transferase [Pseudomonadales bacterium]|nr:FAD:protein FMN transferase [Pseudomonadales bacterium]
MKASTYIHCCVCMLLLASQISMAEWHAHEFDVMGTRASIELWSNSEADAQNSFSIVEAEMRRIESVMSSYIENSELSSVNRLQAYQSLTLTSELYQLIQKSLYFSDLSNGAFDITYASVGHLYNYRDRIEPDKHHIQSALVLVDWQSVILNKKTQALTFAKEGMEINLGGIAKGYAVDRSIELLVGRGVESAIVSAGGDSRMIGDRGAVFNREGVAQEDDAEVNEKTKRIPWMVGIKNPRQAEGTALRMPLMDAAISTSGDYERYFLRGDERVHHIINPKTGYSAEGVVSASVIGSESIDCDVLSTTLFVLGVEKGIDLINTIEGYDAVMIDVDGKVFFSEGLGE